MPSNQPTSAELVDTLSLELYVVKASSGSGVERIANLAAKGRRLVGEISGTPSGNYQRAFQMLKDSQGGLWQNSELFKGHAPDELNYASIAAYYSRLFSQMFGGWLGDNWDKYRKAL